jgi:rhodanese-related sulfurtransferase
LDVAEVAVKIRERSVWRVLWEAAAVALIGAVTALLFNALRPDGLSLVAHTPYQTLVPCPEPGGPVEGLDASAADIHSPQSFLIDARSRNEFEIGHHERAINIPYDWLDPVQEEILDELASSVAASGAARVIVYGDGGRPDSGEYLGKEISGRGIKNVYFIRGGAPAVLLLEGK